jgi:subtilase family serine protease
VVLAEITLPDLNTEITDERIDNMNRRRQLFSTAVLQEQLIECCCEEAPLPDLVVVPRDNISGPESYCRRIEGPTGAGNLEIIVRNQGTAEAGPSTTQVVFEFSGGTHPVVLDTPGIAPDESVTLSTEIPSGCFEPNCRFKITVNSDGRITELDETNNVVEGVCGG